MPDDGVADLETAKGERLKVKRLKVKGKRLKVKGKR
jgi:hypothetical protein